jgi:hypothetical protein
MHAVPGCDCCEWLRLISITSHTKSCLSVGRRVNRQLAHRDQPPHCVALRTWNMMRAPGSSRQRNLLTRPQLLQNWRTKTIFGRFLSRLAVRHRLSDAVCHSRQIGPCDEKCDGVSCGMSIGRRRPGLSCRLDRWAQEPVAILLILSLSLRGLGR